MRSCGCLTRGVTAVDEQRHAAWHAQVAKQLGVDVPGPLGQTALQAARGYRGIGVVDHAKREKDLRTGKSSPGWRRRNRDD